MILAIDTSIRRRIVVVLAGPDGEQIDSARLDDAATAPALSTLMRRFISADIHAVVAATGPGSYTGVRTGMAAALGVAQASGIGLFGVGSLTVVACAAPASARRIRAVSDAGRGGVFVADFVRHQDGSLRAAGAPYRLDVTALSGDGTDVVVSSDPFVGRTDIVSVDHCAALAAVVPLALGGEALEPLGLAAVHVAASSGAETKVKPRV